jgi:hypothetical protein
MSGINQHVVQRENGWAVRGEGNSRDTSHHSTQAEAAAVARGTARNQKSELLIHGRDGRIRERDSYGNDPYPPKG